MLYFAKFSYHVSSPATADGTFDAICSASDLAGVVVVLRQTIKERFLQSEFPSLEGRTGTVELLLLVAVENPPFGGVIIDQEERRASGQSSGSAPIFANGCRTFVPVIRGDECLSTFARFGEHGVDFGCCLNEGHLVSDSED